MHFSCYFELRKLLIQKQIHTALKLKLLQNNKTNMNFFFFFSSNSKYLVT